VVVSSDGRQVWRQVLPGAPRKADTPTAEYVRLAQAYFAGLRLPEFSVDSTLQGQLEVHGTVAWRVEKRLAGGGAVWVDLQVDSGLPLRFGLLSKHLPLCEVELYDYTSYRGIRDARRRVEYVDGMPAAEIVLRDVRVNTGIPPGRFQLSQ
jgi:hypothetical protein